MHKISLVIVVKIHDLRKAPYIFDPLYGIIRLPEFIWKVIPCTELQRLREIRLCNINSFCLVGGANINRYEHAIGTCYLALESLKHWPPLNPVSEREQTRFALAALLHDVLNAPFGHSLEYIESKEGYFPEKSFKNVILEKKSQSYEYRKAMLEPFFFGMPKELASKVSEEDISAIGEIIEGKGRFGPLINGKMDLDNIDNVFRFAYHAGISKSTDVPLKLARSLWTENEQLTIKEDALPLVKQWHNVRKRLYEFLLLNPEEFSAKCMLSEVIEFAKIRSKDIFTWHDTDYEFLLKLSKVPDAREEVKEPILTIDGGFKEEFMNLSISEKFIDLLKENGYRLSPNAQIVATKSGWRIYDKARVYFVAVRKPSLCVCKLVLRGFEGSKVIQRLMKGELYGCIGIFSTSKVERRAMLEDSTQRKELENCISIEIRNRFGGRFRNAIVVLHLIKDIDKTERQITIKTDAGTYSTVGKSSNRLLLGAFFRNSSLTMHNIDPTSEILKSIRNEVKSHLSLYLEDPNLNALEMYGEAKQND